MDDYDIEILIVLQHIEKNHDDHGDLGCFEPQNLRNHHMMFEHLYPFIELHFQVDALKLDEISIYFQKPPSWIPIPASHSGNGGC